MCGRSRLEGIRLSGTLSDRDVERFGQELVADAKIVLHRISFRVPRNCGVFNLMEANMSVKDKVVGVRRSPRISEEEYREKLGLRRLDIFGRELPDGTVVEPPVNFVKTPSIFDTHRELIRKELDARAAQQGFETSEEAENFAIDEDEVPISGHQYTEMEEEVLHGYVNYYNEGLKAAKSALLSKSSPKGDGGAAGGASSPKADAPPPAEPGEA